MKEHFKRLYRYDFWATKVLLDYLLQSNQVTEKSQLLISHLVSAQSIWLSRLCGTTFSGGIFETLPLETVLQMAIDNQGAMQAYLDTMEDSKWGLLLEYKSLKGEPFSNTLADILTHLANHGSHHRAQILSDMKVVTGQVPVLDYIAFARINS